MPVKSDSWIIHAAGEARIIEPFEPNQVKKGVISYGVSSYGYDFRLGYTFKKLIAGNETALDPKNAREELFESFTARTAFDIPAQGIVIAQSLEYFRVPRSLLGICFGKSTYARCGLIVNITPLEPEWEGVLTFPLVNGSTRPITVYPGEGIAQLIFLQSDRACATSYADRKGKYQAQQSITLAKV